MIPRHTQFFSLFAFRFGWPASASYLSQSAALFGARDEWTLKCVQLNSVQEGNPSGSHRKSCKYKHFYYFINNLSTLVSVSAIAIHLIKNNLTQSNPLLRQVILSSPGMTRKPTPTLCNLKQWQTKFSYHDTSSLYDKIED